MRKDSTNGATDQEWRYERKMLPPGTDPTSVEHRIRMHPAGFREIYPPREVNSLYLDTLGRADFNQHIQGLSSRCKTRIRWYGSQNGPIERATLELKIKRGIVGRKENYPITGFQLSHASDAAACEALLNTQSLPAAVLAGLHLRRPSLVNRYARRYYLSANGQVRLTLDSKLQFFDPRHPESPLIHPTRDTQGLVVELKYSPEHAVHAKEVANQLPFRLSRCSKYVEGIRRIQPSLPN